jgi:pteridine reductase
MPDSNKLQGRVALVTGAAKRLGREIATRLAEEGADVAIHYHKSDADSNAVASRIVELGRRTCAVSADLSHTPSIPLIINSVAEHFGRLDILINSAANFLETKFGSITEQSWDDSLNTNLRAPFFLSQAAAPHLAKSGSGAIVNFSDLGAFQTWRGYIPHSIAKAGVIQMTRSLAKELAPKVRVNAIAPGTITMAGDPPEMEARYVVSAPLGRSGRPKDITDAVLYLLTAEFLTGQTLLLDGGRTL